MKYAWIHNGKVGDICQGGDPAEHYHPDVAKLYTTQVPDDAENGDGWVNGQVVKPVAPLPSEPAPREWTEANFRANMTLVEKAKWDSDSTPEIKTVKIELPKKLAGTTELLEFLVVANVISQASADKILE